jgi:hypothetical protein
MFAKKIIYQQGTDGNDGCVYRASCRFILSDRADKSAGARHLNEKLLGSGTP